MQSLQKLVLQVLLVVSLSVITWGALAKERLIIPNIEKTWHIQTLGKSTDPEISTYPISSAETKEPIGTLVSASGAYGKQLTKATMFTHVQEAMLAKVKQGYTNYSVLKLKESPSDVLMAFQALNDPKYGNSYAVIRVVKGQQAAHILMAQVKLKSNYEEAITLLGSAKLSNK